MGKKSRINIESIETLPRYQGIPELLFDSTSPIFAARSSSKGRLRPPQSRDNIKAMAQAVSAEFGFLMDPTHVQDLCDISANEFPLTPRDVYMYFRGSNWALQTSVATSLATSISNVESILHKNQLAMEQMEEATQIASDRLTIMTKRMEEIAPLIIATMKAEFQVIRASIAKLDPFNISVSQPKLLPDKEDITKLFLTMKAPAGMIAKLVAKYTGYTTWELYNRVMTGSVSVKEGLKLMNKQRDEAMKK